MAGADFRRPSDSGPVEGGKRTAGPVVLGLSDIARARRGGWWVDFDDLTRGRVIGEGRFAIVEHCTLRRERAPEALNVAVKFLKPNLLNSPRDLQDFVNEARLLRKIRHPHIVEFIGVGKVDGGGPGQPVRAVYIVHEFMAGGSLKATLVKQMKRPRKAVYSYADALTWLTQIASGLAYLHASTPRVIHRDVKPENVLLTRDARSGRLVAKLADFGLHALVKDSKPGKEGDTQAAVFSRASYASAVSMEEVLSSVEAAHKLTGRAGSLLYMAPEVIMRMNYDEKVDIFSFGTVMYELLQKNVLMVFVSASGCFEDMERYAQSVAEGHRPYIPDFWPPGAKALIADCWSQDPRKRPNSAEVMARLEDLMDERTQLPEGDSLCKCCKIH